LIAEQDPIVKDQTILLTGGASGIGFAVVESLLDNGARVIVSDVAAESLARARTALARYGEQVRFEQFDVADEASVVAAIGRCESDVGPLDGVLNSAGIGRDLPALETSADLFRKILDVNLVGSFLVAREAALRMKTRQRGSIVNVASVSGIRGNVGRVAYGSSKAGVILMTQVLAVELAQYGIRVNAIAPGPIETPMVREMHAPHVRAEWLERMPLRRYGEPNELAGAAMFLLDPAQSGFITGQTIAVDGGFTASGLTIRDAS
jgi:NAD(P)-dependent dehydrogenase (short-subunit alcohol dehydrogenase family)